MTGALALVAALTISSQIQTHPAGLDSIGPSRARSLRTAPIMDKLYQQANKPALDFNFARFKDLHDDATGATSLITFSRSAAQSPGTYVGSDGLIHDAAVNLALYSEQFDLWTNANSIDAANQIASPDGKQTADKLIESGAIPSGANARVAYSLSGFSASTVHSFSIFAKKAERNFLYLGVGGGGLANGEQGWFDLDSGATGSTLNGAVLSIENVGNGWYRCSMQITTTGTSGTVVVGLALSDGGLGGYTGDGTSGIYLWGAQLEETDPATMAPTAYIKTTSQSLAAPRFDHEPTSGNVTTNLLTYSEMFDQWSATNSRVLTNQIDSPVGDLTSDFLQETTANGQHDVRQSTTVASGATYTQSVYAKIGSGSRRLFMSPVGASGFGNNRYVVFDLSAGTATPDGGGTGTLESYSIESVGNGWFRCVVTVTTASTTAFGILRLHNGSTDFYVGDDTSGLYLFGAQLEASPTAGPYVRTLSETRSISDAVAPSLGLLVEEQRANLFVQSEELDVGWSYSGTTVTVTANAATAPDGQSTADLLMAGATGSNNYIGVATSTSGARTASFYVKKNTADFVAMNFGNGTADAAWFDLTNGATATINGGGSSSIADVGNGWYRITHTKPSPLNYFFLSITDADGSLSSTSGKSVYAWGAQLETGSFPSSYIPTVTSQTRYADIAAVQDEDFATTNLLAYSESFDVGWTLTGFDAFGSGSVANATVSPDGQTTADFLRPSTAAGFKGVEQSTAFPATATKTIYVKDSGVRYVQMNFSSLRSLNYANYDLQTATVTQTGGAGFVGASISDAGNGWYRIEITETGAATTATHAISPVPSGTSARGASYAGDGTSGLYLWGASLTATEYPVEYMTTRNLLTDSQDFERWSVLGSGAAAPVINNDFGQTPDGTNTADKIDFGDTSASSGNYSIAYVSASNLVIGTSYRASFYAKAATVSDVGSKIHAYFESTIEEFTLSADWQRFEFSQTATATSKNFVIGARGIKSLQPAFSALVWGAQLEPGTTATDYVRTVDVVGKAYQWYEPTEGTVFVEHENATVTQDIVKFHAGSLSNSFAVYSGSGTSPVFFMRTSGANQASIGVGALSSPFSTSFAVKYNDTNIASNGTAGVPDTSTILPIVDTVDFGSSTVNVGSTSISKHIKRLTYWPVRQSDSTLQVITQ